MTDSYEFRLIVPLPGCSPLEAAQSVIEPNTGFKADEKLRNQRLKEALLRYDLELHVNLEVNSMRIFREFLGGYIFITICPSEYSVSIPFWWKNVKMYQRTFLSKVWEYLKILEKDGGFFLYDRQAERIVNLETDFETVYGTYERYSKKVADLTEPTGKESQSDPDRLPQSSRNKAKEFCKSATASLMPIFIDSIAPSLAERGRELEMAARMEELVDAYLIDNKIPIGRRLRIVLLPHLFEELMFLVESVRPAEIFEVPPIVWAAEPEGLPIPLPNTEKEFIEIFTPYVMPHLLKSIPPELMAVGKEHEIAERLHELLDLCLLENKIPIDRSFRNRLFSHLFDKLVLKAAARPPETDSSLIRFENEIGRLAVFQQAGKRWLIERLLNWAKGATLSERDRTIEELRSASSGWAQLQLLRFL